MKHTPGPWDIYRMGNRIGIFGILPNKRTGEEVCCLLTNNPIDDKVANANFKLISAAPELLDICKHILLAHKSKGMASNGEAVLCQSFVDKLEHIIGKVEGGNN